MNLSTTSRCVQSNPTIEALPGVLGNREIKPFILGETREQKSKTEGNSGTKAILGKREHKKLHFDFEEQGKILWVFFSERREQVPPPPSSERASLNKPSQEVPCSIKIICHVP